MHRYATHGSLLTHSDLEKTAASNGGSIARRRPPIDGGGGLARYTAGITPVSCLYRDPTGGALTRRASYNK